MQRDNNINNKEQWIDQVMASTQGMQRANPPDGLYQAVTGKLNNPPKTRVIFMPYIRWAAAAILLVTINVATIKYNTSLSYAAGQNKKNNNPIATEMQSESTYNY